VTNLKEKTCSHTYCSLHVVKFFAPKLKDADSGGGTPSTLNSKP
jgi:hypothetical protein